MKLLCAAAVVGSLVAGAAAGSPFTELGGAHRERVARAAPPVDLPLAIPADEARRRVETWLLANGFSQAEPAKAAVGETDYVKLADLDDFHALADCQGATIGTPKLWIETVAIGLAPDGGGVRLSATGRFQVLLTGLVSGKPYKITCKSRGVLEGRVREAVAKG